MLSKSELGEKIKVARQSRGLSQRDIAERIGLSSSVVGMYETGKRRPSYEALEALCDVFNVPMSYFSEHAEVADDDELWELREEMRRNPDLRTLFSLTKKATPDDMRKMISIIKTLKGDE